MEGARPGPVGGRSSDHKRRPQGGPRKQYGGGGGHHKGGHKPYQKHAGKKFEKRG